MIFCQHDLASGEHDFYSLEKFQIGSSLNNLVDSSNEMARQRTICLIMDCEASFKPSYFDSLADAFSNSNLTVAYTDFEYVSRLHSNKSRIKPPMWSPERFLSNDFLGPVFAIDFALLPKDLAVKNLTRTQLLLSCISNGLQVSLLDQVGYAVAAEKTEFNYELRISQVTKFFENNRPGSMVTPNGTSWLKISNVKLAPKVISVIIPTRGTKKSMFRNTLILNCLKSLQQQNQYTSKIEVIVVYDSDTKLKYLAKIKKLEAENISISFLSYDPPFNFARKCNLGAELASGEVVLFLNDDTLFLDPNSLLELAGTAMIKNVGAVGAKLLFENGRIQHGGYILRDGFVGHAYIKDIDGFGPFGDLVSTHEVLGVTGACLAQRREIWDSIGKWNESFPASYNDVDYCFRITESGLNILQVNQAKLKHFESVTRNPKVYPREREMIQDLWGHKFKVEPFFRMKVTTPEMRNVHGNVLKRYTNYAKATYRREGLSGIWGLFTNVARKVLKVSEKN